MIRKMAALLIACMMLVSCGAVKDETPPVITVAETDLHVTPANKTADIAGMIGFTATDDVDGDLSSKISVDTSGIKFEEPGKYTVTATVTDSAGNSASKKVTVTVDVSPSVFALRLDPVLKDILRNSEANNVKPILLHYERSEKIYYWDVYDTLLNDLLDQALTTSSLQMLKKYLNDSYCDILTVEVMHYFEQYDVPDPLVLRIYNDPGATSLLFRIEDGKIIEDNVGLDRTAAEFDPIPVYEDEYVSISFVEIADDALIYEVNNKTDRNLTIQADAVSVNGVSSYDIIMSDDVAPQSIGKIMAMIHQTDILGALDVLSTSGQFRIIDFADRDWRTRYACFDVQLRERSGYYESEYDDLLYTDDNVDIYYWKIDKDAVYFLLRNKTERCLTVQANSISINRHSVSDIIMSDDVAPHSVGIIVADCSPEYDGNVQTVGGQLRIIDFADRDWHSYSATFTNVEIKN